MKTFIKKHIRIKTSMIENHVSSLALKELNLFINEIQDIFVSLIDQLKFPVPVHATVKSHVNLNQKLRVRCSSSKYRSSSHSRSSSSSSSSLINGWVYLPGRIFTQI